MQLEKISHFVRDDSSRISMSFRADARNLCQHTRQEIQNAPLPKPMIEPQSAGSWPGSSHLQRGEAKNLARYQSRQFLLIDFDTVSRRHRRLCLAVNYGDRTEDILLAQA